MQLTATRISSCSEIFIAEEWKHFKNSLPVFQGETCQFGAIIDPFEFKGPAALSHAGEDQTVPLQVNLGLRRLHLKIRWDIIYWKEKKGGGGKRKWHKAKKGKRQEEEKRERNKRKMEG